MGQAITRVQELSWMGEREGGWEQLYWLLNTDGFSLVLGFMSDTGAAEASKGSIH